MNIVDILLFTDKYTIDQFQPISNAVIRPMINIFKIAKLQNRKCTTICHFQLFKPELIPNKHTYVNI